MGQQKQAGLAETALRSAPGIYSTLARINEVKTGPMPGVLSILSGLYGMGEAGVDMHENGVGLGNSWGMAKGAGGVLSGYAGTSGAAAAALGTEGGLAGAFGASALGATGCVAGAGLAGIAAGTMLNALTNSDATKESGWWDDDATMEKRSYSDWVTDKSLEADDFVDDLIGGEEGSFRDGVGDVLGTGVGMASTVHGHLAGGIPSLASSAWGAVFD